MAPRERENVSASLALRGLTSAAQRAGLDVTDADTQEALRALSTPQGMSLLVALVADGRRARDGQLLFSSSENGLTVSVSYLPQGDADNAGGADGHTGGLTA